MVAKGVSINHPLGFIWHPLEGAGMIFFFLRASVLRVKPLIYFDSLSKGVLDLFI